MSNIPNINNMPTHIRPLVEYIWNLFLYHLDQVYKPRLNQGTGTIGVGGGGGGGVTGTLPIANGGTGATTAPTALTSLGAASAAALAAEIARAEAAEAALSGGTVHKYATTIGDGSSTSFVLTHGLGNTAVSVTARATASPYAEVSVADETTTANTVTIYASPAPASGALVVTIIG